MKTRLFIGNLAPTVTEGELRDKFEALLSSHQDEAQVGDVEVRCKNENNHFGYVDIYLKNGVIQEEKEISGSGVYSRLPAFLRKNINLMNNTTWKGSLIKVQPAKESFIEKLRKEQANRVQNDKKNEPDPQSKEYNSEQSRLSRQANDVLHKLNKSKERFSKRGESLEINKDIDKGGNFGFEIVTNDHEDPKKTSPKKSRTSIQKKRKKKNVSSSSDDSSDDDVRDGIPKFKGLMAFYPNGPPPPLAVTPIEDKPAKAKVGKEEEDVDMISEKAPIQIQKTLPPKAIDANFTSIENPKELVKQSLLAPSKPVSSGGVNFKKNKQQKSDMLRMQSMEKLKELKTQRSHIINTSLSSVTAIPPQTENRKEIEEAHDEISAKTKKPAMALFDDNDSDEDATAKDESSFGVKKQFEGEGGQRLLELQTRWGHDDRFKIDDRFKESDNEEEMEPVEQEKEKQLNILTGILGKVLSPSKTSSKSKTNSSKETFSSVILPRYDPEAEDEVEPSNDREEDSPSKSKKSKKKEKEVNSEKQEEKPIRSNEPVTFKTVSNLKELFSSSGDTEKDVQDVAKSTKKDGGTPSTSGSFSLLAAFGNADEEEEEDVKDNKATSKNSSSAGPRSFWQANPFRYDSSDDEDDDNKKGRVKVTINTDVPAKTSDLFIHGKASFFFTKNDPRFDGLDDYFLKEEVAPSNETGEGDDNNQEQGTVEDFTVKRQELKAIVKAKIRNTKRKDEKRTLAIKRAIRKRKRKLHQRGRKI